MTLIKQICVYVFYRTKRINENAKKDIEKRISNDFKR